VIKKAILISVKDESHFTLSSIGLSPRGMLDVLTAALVQSALEVGLSLDDVQKGTEYNFTILAPKASQEDA
jgi:hypothetical protein